MATDGSFTLPKAVQVLETLKNRKFTGSLVVSDGHKERVWSFDPVNIRVVTNGEEALAPLIDVLERKGALDSNQVIDILTARDESGLSDREAILQNSGLSADKVAESLRDYLQDEFISMLLWEHPVFHFVFGKSADFTVPGGLPNFSFEGTEQLIDGLLQTLAETPEQLASRVSNSLQITGTIDPKPFPTEGPAFQEIHVFLDRAIKKTLIYDSLARAFEAAGNLEEASKYFTLLAHRQANSGRGPEAKKTYQEAARTDSQNFEAREALVALYAGSGEKDRSFEEARALGEAYREIGLPARATWMFKKAESGIKDASLLGHLLDLAIEQDNWEDVETYGTALLSLFSSEGQESEHEKLVTHLLAVSAGSWDNQECVHNMLGKKAYKKKILTLASAAVVLGFFLIGTTYEMGARISFKGAIGEAKIKAEKQLFKSAREILENNMDRNAWSLIGLTSGSLLDSLASYEADLTLIKKHKLNWKNWGLTTARKSLAELEGKAQSNSLKAYLATKKKELEEALQNVPVLERKLRQATKARDARVAFTTYKELRKLVSSMDLPQDLKIPLQISTNPPDAQVNIEEFGKGPAPFEIWVPARSALSVSIRKRGFKTWKRTIFPHLDLPNWRIKVTLKKAGEKIPSSKKRRKRRR